jgi:hypothetical protein
MRNFEMERNGERCESRKHSGTSSIAPWGGAITNYFLHFRVISTLMYYLPYRALVHNLRPYWSSSWIDAVS